MPRETVVKNAPAPTYQQQAHAFAAGLESVSQVIGWLQVQDQDAVAAAKAQVAVPQTEMTLNDLKQVAEKVKYWALAAEKPPVQDGEGAGSTDAAASVAPSAPLSPPTEPTTPAEPKTELETLRDRVKALELAEESRSARQKKMAACLSRIDRAENALRQSVAELKEAKGEHEAAEAELANALNELKLTAKGLPIQLNLPINGTPPEMRPMGVKQGEGEAWKDTLLSSLDIPAGTIKKLAEHEPALTTLGKLTDWQKKKGDFWAKDIKGIGEAAAEAISKACDKYWAEHSFTPATTPAANGAKNSASGTEAAVSSPVASPPPSSN